MKQHPAGRFYTVTIIRADGTHWVKERVKHLIEKSSFIVLYQGEHGRDRRETWIPIARIDHFTIEESTETPL